MRFNFKFNFIHVFFLKTPSFICNLLKIYSFFRVSRVFLPVLIFLFYFLLTSPVLYAADKKAYKPGRLPYNNYMKSLQNFSTEDIDRVNKAFELTVKKNLTEEELEQINSCGKFIYEKYKTDIDLLIKNYDKLINEKNPRPSDAQYRAIRSSAPMLDLSYTAITIISRRLESEKRFEDALKLSTLSWRFGQIVLNGDGGISSLITAMIGIAVKNFSAQENLCRIMISGDFDAEFYQKYSKNLLKLSEDEMDMAGVMECERRTFINVLEYEIFIKNSKSEYAEIINKIPDGRLEEAKKYAVDNFNSFYDSVSVFLVKYKSEPYELRKKLQVLSREITEKSEPSLWQLLNPLKAAGDILLSIAMPNFSRAYEQILRAKYYSYGTAVCAGVLAALKKGAEFPSTIDMLEKISEIKLWPDYFDKNKGTLKYKKMNEHLTLYSNGFDYTDDGADPVKDIVLFKIPIPKKEK